MTETLDARSRTESPVREVPRVEWNEFVGNVFRWQQGEHVGLIGPTGSGKTTLLLSLLDYRSYVVVVGTKPRDRVLAQLKRRGYVRLKSWDSKLSPRTTPRRLLWPDATDLESEPRQRAEIMRGLADIYRQGYWCVVVDELWYLIHHLKMERQVRTFLQQARALDISLVVATQRPAFVPLEVYDQSTHLFFWRDNDERNLSRISGISWLSANLVRGTVARLDKYEVLYVNTRDGVLYKTTPPPPTSERR